MLDVGRMYVDVECECWTQSPKFNSEVYVKAHTGLSSSWGKHNSSVPNSSAICSVCFSLFAYPYQYELSLHIQVYVNAWDSHSRGQRLSKRSRMVPCSSILHFLFLFPLRMYARSIHFPYRFHYNSLLDLLISFSFVYLSP